MSPLRDDQEVESMKEIAISLTHRRVFVIVFYGEKESIVTIKMLVPQRARRLPIALYSQFHRSVNKITARLKYNPKYLHLNAIASTKAMAVRCGTSTFNAWSRRRS
jgi:hypothetical protein